LGLAVAALPFAEDLVEWPDFGEEQVAHRAARLAVRPDVIGPNVPNDELIGLDLEFFESEQVMEGALFFGGDGLAQLDGARVLTDDRVGETVGYNAEIVPDPAVEEDFFER